MADDSLLTRSVFRVPGMDCPTEEQLIRMALAEVMDVRTLDFDLGARHLEAVHAGDPTPILAALEPLGMGAVLEGTTPIDPAEVRPDASRTAAADSQRRALWFVLGINAVMFVIEMGAGLAAQSTGLVADSARRTTPWPTWA